MAEAPGRYCSNCGQALSPEDRFCPGCGRPVHRTASVPTPEADVPVPPPPRAGGAGATTAQQQPTWRAGWGRRHPILTGCLGIIALFFLFGIIGAALGGGGGSVKKDEPVAAAPTGDEEKKAKEKSEKKEQPQAQKKPKPKPEYSVGQKAKVGNVQWSVKDASLTDQLKSSFGTQKRGRFIVVDFTFTNNRDEEVTLDPELHMILKDSQGREFGSDPDAWEFVPANLMIFLEPVNPGVSTDGRVIYEVASDANGFTLTLDDVELLEDKSAVFDLGNIGSEASSPSSASQAAQSQPAVAEEQARSAAESYYQAVAARDWEYTYDHLDSETQSAYTEQEWFAKNDYLADTGAVTYTIQSVAMDSSAPETLAYVTVVLTATDGSTNVRNTFFVYEDGVWKHRFSAEEYDLLAGAPVGTASATASSGS